ncbi:DUF2273 domain-containing protein [Streptococcus merionis]|uniref:DUF2273 domain-containing protein n=1 Tax=Streptococcus merionis TaxID=400065 RepID=UPI00351522CD
MSFFERYKYSLVGGLVGLILVLFIMTLGFWKTILIFVVVGLCAYLGTLFEDSGILEAIIARLKR